MNFKEIQILISWISFSTILLRFAKLFSSTVVVSSRIILKRGRSLFLRTVFFKSIFSRFPYKTERKKIQGHISRRSNSCFDFAFCCKSEIRISKSKSRFPNRSCLMSSKNTWFLPHLTPRSHLTLNKNGAKVTAKAHGFVRCSTWIRSFTAFSMETGLGFHRSWVTPSLFVFPLTRR